MAILKFQTEPVCLVLWSAIAFTSCANTPTQGPADTGDSAVAADTDTGDGSDASDAVDASDTSDTSDELPADVDADTLDDERDSDNDTSPLPDDAVFEDAEDAEDTDDTDAVDDISGDADPPAPCPTGSACTVLGYVPPCFEGRCNARETCQLTRIAHCCALDADCAPTSDLAPCETLRCVSRLCTRLPTPGCCANDMSCDDGLPHTVDTCSADTYRCRHCEPSCASAPTPPIFERRFDTEAPLTTLGFTVIDPQPNDQVTWQPSTRRFAAGTGALYLGNARCMTYYGGALGADCRPTSPGEQDSQRVSLTLVSPFFTLPSDTPSVATLLVWSQVEPLLGRGDAEPDTLRVLIEPLSAPAWRVASTLQLGKSTDWAPIAIGLGPWRGQTVRFRFEFDTFDGENNLFEGVWLDELVVAPTCASGGCCERDADCPASLGCNQTRCLPLSGDGAGVCATVPRAPGTPCATCVRDAECNDADPCTADTCALSPDSGDTTLGVCTHHAFCCLERDLLAADFASTLAPLSTSPVSEPAVRWQVRDGRAWFGDNASQTYASPSGSRVSGTLTSPPIALPTTLTERQSLALRFTLELDTEWSLGDPLAFDNPAGLDRLTVQVADGALTTTLWTSDLITGSTRGEAIPLDLDLAPWRGRTIVVRFTFDSGDANANDFTGPFLDDLTVGLGCR